MIFLKKLSSLSLVGFIFFISPNIFAEKSIIISDIDDTIKQTGIHQTSTIGVNAPSTINEFAGMSILYNSWYENNKATGNIYYLTAAPKFIDNLGIQFLEASAFPPRFDNISKHVVSGRNPIKKTSGKFKTKKLIEIFEKEKPDTIILIGDNGEQDIIAYGNLITHLQVIKAKTKVYSFIHHVYEAANKSISIPATQTAFLTSADLAVHFYNQTWINKEALIKNLNEVVYDSDSNSGLTETVVPSFMECKKFNSWPKLNSQISENSDLLATYLQIQSNLQTICK